MPTSARFVKENFSHRHCERSEAIQKPYYLRAFQRFCLELEPYLTFSNFAILPLKYPFLPSPSQVHANTPNEGTHVLKPSIYLDFIGISLVDDFTTALYVRISTSCLLPQYTTDKLR